MQTGDDMWWSYWRVIDLLNTPHMWHSSIYLPWCASEDLADSQLDPIGSKLADTDTGIHLWESGLWSICHVNASWHPLRQASEIPRNENVWNAYVCGNLWLCGTESRVCPKQDYDSCHFLKSSSGTILLHKHPHSFHVHTQCKGSQAEDTK